MWNDEWRLSCYYRLYCSETYHKIAVMHVGRWLFCFYRLYCNTYHKIAVMHVERWLSCFYKLYCNTYHKIAVLHVERWMAAVLLLQIELQHITHNTNRSNACGTMNGGCPAFTDCIATPNTYHKIAVMHVERWMAAVLLLQIVLQHITHTTKSQ